MTDEPDDEPEFELDREEQLRRWVEQTSRINAALRAKGIEPNYTCSFDNGEFVESRK